MSVNIAHNAMLVIASIAIYTSLFFASIAHADSWNEIKVDIYQKQDYSNRSKAPDHLEPGIVLFPQEKYLIEYYVLGMQHEKYLLKIYRKNDSTILELFTITIDTLPVNITADNIAKAIRTTPIKNMIIDSEMAEIIYKTWVNMLLETRYSKFHEHVLYDGPTYNFSAYVNQWGWFHGYTDDRFFECDTPQKWLVEMGEILRQLIDENKVSEIESSKKKLKVLSNKIFSYLRKNGIPESDIVIPKPKTDQDINDLEKIFCYTVCLVVVCALMSIIVAVIIIVRKKPGPYRKLFIL